MPNLSQNFYEIDNLFSVDDNFKKIILTNKELEDYPYFKGGSIVNVIDWLME